MENSIRVGVRIRPLTAKDTSESPGIAVAADGAARLSVSLPQPGKDDNGKKVTYAFDYVYDMEANQRFIYEQMAKPLIERLFEGYHATFFAYGQTGAGKTYTMGTAADFSSGIVPFAVTDIFAKAQHLQLTQHVTVDIQLSYMEIYMEDCFDLLAKDAERKKLELRETPNGETFLEGLTIHPVKSLDEVATFLSNAAKVRATNKTAMNLQSSRSHAICTLYLRIQPSTTASQPSLGHNNGCALLSRLNLVDLAGSERVKKTQSTGEVFQEGVNINRGLLALGNVVSALVHKAKQPAGSGSSHTHVPYRESKLTRLLKDSLGGNGITVLLACVAPGGNNVEETLNTLRFASRVSCVVNTAEVNREMSVDALVQENARLRNQLQGLQEKLEQSIGGKMPGNLAMDADDDQRRRSSTSSASSRTDSRHEACLQLAATLKLCYALKSFLMFLLNDDVEVEESLIEALRDTLKEIRTKLGYESTHLLASKPLTESLDMSFTGLLMDDHCLVPPIVAAIDELNHFEAYINRFLQAHYPNTINSDTSEEENEGKTNQAADLSIIAGCNLLDINGLDEEEFVEEETMLIDDENEKRGLSKESDNDEEQAQKKAAVFAAKEQKISSMKLLTDQYKNAIQELTDEVKTLEKERDLLLNQQTSPADSNSDIINSNSQINRKGQYGKETDVTNRIKQELRQKTKLLEEKVKVLRAKELEYQRLCRVQDKLTRDLELMKAKELEYKKHQVHLMKKIRTEILSHQVDSKQFKAQELQSKKKIQQAEMNAVRIEHKLSSQERYWKTKYAAKEFECQQLRELMKKHEDNRQQKDQNASSRAAKVINSSNNGNAIIPYTELNQKFMRQIQQQRNIALQQVQLTMAMEQRQFYQRERIQIKMKLKRLRPSSKLFIHWHKKLQEKDIDIASITETITALQASLQSLPAQVVAQDSLTSWISEQLQDEPKALKYCLLKLWRIHHETCKETQRWKLQSMKQGEAQTAFASTPGGKVKSDHEEETGDHSNMFEDVSSLFDDANHGRESMMDESFHPSDENDDGDEDDEDNASQTSDASNNFTPHRKRRIHAKKTRQSLKKSRSSLESAPSQGTRDSSDRWSLESDLKSSKWSSLTIKQLKAALIERKLPVSGSAFDNLKCMTRLKLVLIRRLVEYDLQQQQIENIPPQTLLLPEDSQTNAPIKKTGHKQVLSYINDGYDDVLSPATEFQRRYKSQQTQSHQSQAHQKDDEHILVEKATTSSSSMLPVVNEQVLSKDEELQAFRARFLSSGNNANIKHTS